jgi:hypothetical protein
VRKQQLPPFRLSSQAAYRNTPRSLLRRRRADKTFWYVSELLYVKYVYWFIFIVNSCLYDEYDY